jgi:hypothetical protein
VARVGERDVVRAIQVLFVFSTGANLKHHLSQSDSDWLRLLLKICLGDYLGPAAAQCTRAGSLPTGQSCFGRRNGAG